MGPSGETPLAEHRRRMKQNGVVRVEVQVDKEDAALVRAVARALTDPARDGPARALLRRYFAEPRAGLKALLAAAPLKGVTIERARDPGRPVDL